MKQQIVFLLVILSSAAALDPFNYEKLGEDWPGTCGTGQRQSPININEGINTKEDAFSEVEFNYKISTDLADKIKNAMENGVPLTFDKMKFNGYQLELNTDIGPFSFKHATGEKEYYNANKIVLHYPAEHYVTQDGQTPRFALEMQIEHTLTKTDSQALTDKVIKVKKAIVSILFLEAQNAPAGDLFLSRMGIDARRKNADGSYRVVGKDQFLDFSNDEIKRGSEAPGFDIDALAALRNLLNLDHQIFRYFGSETQPPCDENVQWFVFGMPRAISTAQTEFFRQQLAKKREDAESLALVNIHPLAAKWFGNNRQVHPYDPVANGNIQNMLSGISKIEGMPQPKL